MPSCDVLIVGGGPAGSSCAWKLHREGADVLVLDKETFPRDKLCAGWVTPQVFDCLELDPQDYAGDHLLEKLTSFRIGLVGGDSEVTTRYGRAVSYAVRRRQWDHFLLARSGARCLLGRGLETIRRRGGRWIVNGEISAPLVVAAGGHFCPVARRLGAGHSGRASVVISQEVEFALTGRQAARLRIDPETPELFFCADFRGYGWCFRKGNYLNIGLGRIGSRRISLHVRNFCDFLRRRGKVPFDIPARFRGHAYRLYQTVEPKLLDDAAVLVGDAAGLAFPQSGEGIRPAVESGLIAADVILAAGAAVGRDDLQPYRTRILARFGKPRPGGVLAHVPGPWLRRLGARLLATRWFTRRVVMDRWFLHRRQPGLRMEDSGDTNRLWSFE